MARQNDRNEYSDDRRQGRQHHDQSRLQQQQGPMQQGQFDPRQQGQFDPRQQQYGQQNMSQGGFPGSYGPGSGSEMGMGNQQGQSQWSPYEQRPDFGGYNDRVQQNMGGPQGNWGEQGAYGNQRGIAPRYGNIGMQEDRGMYSGQNRSGQYGGGSFQQDQWNQGYGPQGYGSQGPSFHAGGQQTSRGYGGGSGFESGFNRVANYGEMGGYGRQEYGAGYQQNQQGQDFRGVGPRGYRRSSDSIRDEVCERLTDHPRVNPSELEVDVDDDGIVQLSGRIDSRYSKRMVEDVVDHVRGVRDVRNELEIQDREFGGESRSMSGSQQDQKSNGSAKKESRSKKKD